MHTPLLFALALFAAVLPGMATAQPAAGVSQLELDRRCGQCHDFAADAGAAQEDWLQRLRRMGSLDHLTATQQQELLGFLRHHGWEVAEIVRMADERHLFEEKCGLCHSPARIFVEEPGPEKRREIVERMRARAPEWISREQASTIVSFLEAGARGVRRPEHIAVTDDPADIFRVRCGICHPLERAYLYLETHGSEAAWGPLIERMRLRAPTWISADEAEKVRTWLATQPKLLP